MFARSRTTTSCAPACASPLTTRPLADAPGRPLPAEYRATRAKANSFMGLATNTDYATEVTLQPLERYPLTRPSCSATSSPCPMPWAWA